MSLTLTPTDHRHAHRVLEVVHHGTTAETSDLVARSWQRCLQEHHLHPDRPRKPPVLAKSAMEERCQRLADLIDCARYEMTTLYQQLADPESAVVLTDTDPAANGPLRQRLRPRGFGLVLIDTDGRVAHRRPLPVTVRELSNMIDRMPSRREETGSRRP